MFFLTFFVLCFFSFIQSYASEFYSYTKSETVIGSLKTYAIKNDESLIELARKFKIGYNEIIEANPGLDPFVPGADKTITVPTSWILPDLTSREGIVINLSEMRLYFFSKKISDST